jgi:hypothetical protein
VRWGAAIMKALRTPDEQRNFLRKFIEKQIEAEAQIAKNISSDEDPYVSKTIGNALRSWRQSSREVIAEFEKQYEKELKLKAKGNRFPTKWMQNDPAINANLDKYPISETLNHIDKVALTQIMRESLFEYLFVRIFIRITT